jgi:hypothetical protein
MIWLTQKKESELEFLGQETINDAVLELGNKLNMKILAPLTASIYYKGSRALLTYQDSMD